MSTVAIEPDALDEIADAIDRVVDGVSSGASCPALPVGVSGPLGTALAGLISLDAAVLSRTGSNLASTAGDLRGAAAGARFADRPQLVPR